jgi:hypothetical protein
MEQAQLDAAGEVGIPFVTLSPHHNFHFTTTSPHPSFTLSPQSWRYSGSGKKRRRREWNKNSLMLQPR